MTPCEVESRGSETRLLKQLLMRDERDTWLESSIAFIMPRSSTSTPSGRVKQCGFIILVTFESSVIMLLCAVVTCLIKHSTY